MACNAGHSSGTSKCLRSCRSGCDDVQVSRILRFNKQLEALKGDSELVPGVGRTSVWGGKYDSASGEGKSRDLRDLFKVYIEERLRRDGEITEVRLEGWRPWVLVTCCGSGSAATRRPVMLICVKPYDGHHRG